MTGRRVATGARVGLTLFEIVLATVILAGGLAVLTPQLETARQATTRAAREAEALNRAESLLNLAVAQASSGEPSPQTTDAGDGWTDTLEIATGELPTLLTLTATSEHVGPGGSVDASVTLHRLLFVPSLAEGTP